MLARSAVGGGGWVLGRCDARSGSNVEALHRLGLKAAGDRQERDDEEEHAFVQELDVSNCGVKSLAPLAKCADLVWLDASNNELREVLDFETPCSAQDGGAMWIGSNLEFADLSFNQIPKVPNLGVHVNLRELNLSNNCISHVGDLGALVLLESLDLSHNSIDTLRGMGKMEALVELRVEDNHLRSLRFAAECPQLQRLRCAANEIQSLDGCEACKFLEVVDLRDNSLKQFARLEPLRHLVGLNALQLRGNPIEHNETEELVYRRRVIVRLQQLTLLDGDAVSARDKVQARNFYGEDMEHRRQVFLSYFPGEEDEFASVGSPYEDPERFAAIHVPLAAERVAGQALDQGVAEVSRALALPRFISDFCASAIATAQLAGPAPVPP